MKQAQIDKLADHLAAKTFWASNVEDREKIEDDFGNVLSEKKVFDNLEEMFSAKVIEVSDDKSKFSPSHWPDPCLLVNREKGRRS